MSRIFTDFRLAPSRARSHPSTSNVTSRYVRPLRREQLHEEKFNSLWRIRKPILVTGLHEDFQTPWTPEYFIEQYGRTPCEVEDCQTGRSHTCTVADFFSLFNHSDDTSRRILKLKDWPPTASFKSVFAQLHDDFERVVPLPEYTTATGAKNLAAHFPLNSVVPDLGPKMYNALASVFDDAHSGSTKLHLDASDAVNLLTYASHRSDGSAGYALWHIFAPEDTDAIRAYLKQRGKKSSRSGDPIHNQDTYLTPSMLQELREKLSVSPYVIKQYLGDAIFIPAGCSHQVSNQANCIKVACDFISPESVPFCKRLCEEFREQRLARKWPPDVIPFAHMLYYTWISVSTMSSPSPAG
ncbi:hypothetical protein LXA43DRAFT_895611 [Ganoderma leucocontextum]|nr:hypothetical protein LXA43DRAFT_895611 [Ganoderma leucocontextum]